MLRLRLRTLWSLGLKSIIDQCIDASLEYTGTHHGSSRWAQFRECPRGHRLRYEDGVSLIEQPDYFKLGQLVHAGLGFAALGEIEGFDWDLDDLYREIERRELFEPDIFYEGKRLLKSYFRFWNRANAGYGSTKCQILEVEHFVCSKKLKIRYTGRVDCLLLAEPFENSHKEHLVIVDHKTRKYMPKDGDSELAARWSTKPQFLGLAYCVREIEGEIPAFCVNVISKTIVPQYRRVIWLYTDEELDRWGEEHDKCLEHLDADYMNYSSCAPDIGNPCWAFDWCHGTDEDRERLYKINPPKRKKEGGYISAH